MALTSDDYLDLINAVIECVDFKKEQQESARLIKEKLEELNRLYLRVSLHSRKIMQKE